MQWCSVSGAHPGGVAWRRRDRFWASHPRCAGAPKTWSVVLRKDARTIPTGRSLLSLHHLHTSRHQCTSGRPCRTRARPAAQCASPTTHPNTYFPSAGLRKYGQAAVSQDSFVLSGWLSDSPAAATLTPCVGQKRKSGSDNQDRRDTHFHCNFSTSRPDHHPDTLFLSMLLKLSVQIAQSVQDTGCHLRL